MGLKMVGWSCLSCKLTTLQCWMTQGHRYHRIFWWSSVDYPWAMLILEFLSSNRTCKGELQLGYNTRKGLAQNKKTSIKPLLIRSPFFSLAAKEKHTIWWPSKGLGERPWGICAGQQPWKICAILGHRSLTPSTFFSLSLANPRYSCKELHRLQRTGVQIIVQVQNNSLNQISIEPRIQQVASNPNTPVHRKKKKDPQQKSGWCDVPMNLFNENVYPKALPGLHLLHASAEDLPDLHCLDWHPVMSASSVMRWKLGNVDGWLLDRFRHGWSGCMDAWMRREHIDKSNVFSNQLLIWCSTRRPTQSSMELILWTSRSPTLLAGCSKHGKSHPLGMAPSH